ncbi:hypothetical protein [Nitratireductor sp. GCM10026969]|uniref:hypothetical protein n=1 Tax=Nitratireductor sp. GCM10026969 TaxID=3252645 RepID=UPI003610512C
MNDNAEKLSEVEVMALRYLADAPGGRHMFVEPNLARAIKSIAEFHSWALSDFARSPQDGDHSVVAEISEEGRAAIERIGATE